MWMQTRVCTFLKVNTNQCTGQTQCESLTMSWSWKICWRFKHNVFLVLLALILTEVMQHCCMHTFYLVKVHIATCMRTCTVQFNLNHVTCIERPLMICVMVNHGYRDRFNKVVQTFNFKKSLVTEQLCWTEKIINRAAVCFIKPAGVATLFLICW